MLVNSYAEATPQEILCSVPDEGHSLLVYCLQFDNDHLASGSRDKSIRIWDFKTNQLVLPPLIYHKASVLCLKFDKHSDILISGDVDGDVAFWQFSTGKLMHTIEKAHRDHVLNLTFNERFLVTSGRDALVKVWDLHSRDLLRSLEGHRVSVNSVDIHGGTIVSASGDGTVRLWDIETGKNTRVICNQKSGSACVQFAAAGRVIVSGGMDKTIQLHDVNGTQLARLEGHTAMVRCLQAWISGEVADLHSKPTVERIVSGGYDGRVAIWEREANGQWSVNKWLDMTDKNFIFALRFDENRLVYSCGSLGKLYELIF